MASKHLYVLSLNIIASSHLMLTLQVLNMKEDGRLDWLPHRDKQWLESPSRSRTFQSGWQRETTWVVWTSTSHWKLTEETGGLCFYLECIYIYRFVFVFVFAFSHVTKLSSETIHIVLYFAILLLPRNASNSHQFHGSATSKLSLLADQQWTNSPTLLWAFCLKAQD